MATAADARAVKCLDESGRKRFVFKSFSERIEELDIGVYRSLVPVNAEPSEGSTFFRDCLIEWRELNTAEDFITFYEESMPFVQTLPQIIFHKEMIFTKLLSRLQMSARLSLEPILRLIVALARDLLKDFEPFLLKVVCSLVSLLKSGADREPEIIDQIFTSWSCIMMHLQKYLTQDIVSIVRTTVKLRYYSKDYVQEFMAESVSFLLRNSPVKQLIKGIRIIMLEVNEKPVEFRKSGSSALLWYAMRGASSKLHSRAGQILRLLVDKSILDIGENAVHDRNPVMDVVTSVFQRLCEELEANELNLPWDCLIQDIYESVTVKVTNGSQMHLSRLLSLLVTTIEIEHVKKLSDFKPFLQLIEMLIREFITPSAISLPDDQPEVVNKVLQLMGCILDGLHLSSNMAIISCLSNDWSIAFKLRNSSLLTFIHKLLLKDTSIIYAFRLNIISSLSELLEDHEEEVILLLVIFCEKIKVPHSNFIEEVSKKEVSKISKYLQKNVNDWIQTINNIVCGELDFQFESPKLALLWGVISCYPYMIDIQLNSSFLLDFVDSVDKLLKTVSGRMSDYQCQTWEGLIGAAISSYNNLLIDNQNRDRDLRYFSQLAIRYKLSPQILNSVADLLDSINGLSLKADKSNEELPVKIGINKSDELFCELIENLSHPKKIIRLSTLRILCHIDPCNSKIFNMNQNYLDEKMSIEASEASLTNKGVNVLQLFLSIETTPLSVGSSRTIDLLISKLETGLAAGNINNSFISSALYAIIGILHNRFTYLWEPALKCLAILISKHIETTWDKFVNYLEHCLVMCLASKNMPDDGKTESTTSDLVERFNLFLSPASDSSTPWMSVLSSLIQCLQRIPSLTESKSRQTVPLFLRFLGYNNDDVVCVWSFCVKACKGKDWKSILKEWLQLFKLMRNPKYLYKSHFLKEVMQQRLLDDNDYEIQIKVLDCLLNWKDSSLLPYDQHLKKLICSKNLREELTTWSLSKESKLIEDHHRTFIIPLVIQILMPKVRTLKILASRKHKSLNHRKAVLGFLSNLEINELMLFFALLLKPLLNLSPIIWFEEISKWSWNPHEMLMNNADMCSILKYFTNKNILSLSWKKRNSFLHVVEDILGVFDELHTKPYLDLLMGSVIRILLSCTVSIDCWKKNRLTEDEKYLKPFSYETISDADDHVMTSTPVKQLKDIRTLCLKIICFSINKYEDHDYGCGFWDMFFASVKPLIDGFKREGASSEKPSSLFSCFLAMSRSHKLVYLLHKENNLVPDIFSMLNVETASEAIVSCVLKFVQNLLDLDNELDEGDDAIKRVLLPNLDVLVCSLHRLFRSNTFIRKLVKSRGERELRILKPLSKYIKDPSAAMKFIDILLFLLSKGIQNPDTCIEALEVIRQLIPILNDHCTRNILDVVPSLLISAGQDVRCSICDLLDGLAKRDSSVIAVAKLIHELNATSTTEVGSLDYDAIIAAYENIRLGFFRTVREEHALIFLSHAVHDMSSEELILRQSAYSLLLSFIEFSAETIGTKKVDGCWTEACIHNFLLKHMGDAMTKGSSVQKIWLDLLREMVLKLPTVHILEPFRALCNEDADQDFFNNVLHLQTHRRARALTKFANYAGSGNLLEAVLSKIFIPLFFAILFDAKAEHLKNACVEALASISVNMKWQSYNTFLNKCFREQARRPDKQRILLKLICSILDKFHFTEGPINEEADFSAMDVSKSGIVDATHSTKSIDISEIHSCLQKSILPKIQKLVSSDGVDVNTNLVMLKVLKLLPIDVMEVQLPSIIHRISNFLKHRLESIRDEARIALAACLKELGLDYLLFVVKTVKSILRRGYELHVLGYTLNFLLSNYLATPTIGGLDYCLDELLSVSVNDILGDVSEQKEVDKIASKMKETRKVKSFDSLKIISQNVTFKTHALKTLLPITARLQKHMTPKLKAKLENMLSNIAVGFESNPSVNQTDLFIFIYSLIDDGINCENHKHATTIIKPNQATEDEVSPSRVTNGRLIDAGPQCSHLVTVFALRMLQNRLKNNKADKKEEQLLKMLDSFVRLLSDCLSSKYEDVMAAAVRCLVPLLSLPLPSIKLQANKIKMSLFVIAQGSLNATSPLMESCLKLMTVLLKSTEITLSTDQLHMLIQFPVFVDLERNPSFVALSLLEAIIRRKLVVHEIYDVVTCVAELAVTSQVDTIRKKCSQILLQFLLDYHISHKRFQQHLDFLLSNLRYEHASGRESVLEMLHAIIVKSPKNIINEHSHMIFLHLVVGLANDNDSKVLLMIGAVIKLLIGHVSSRSLDPILESTLSWYSDENKHLWSAAAQVLGFLVEVMKKGFGRYNNNILSIMKVILQSSMKACENRELSNSDEAAIPMWKEAYFSLIMFEKMLHQFQDLCLASELEDIWNIICELLWHPHMSLRNISNRLVAVYFNSIADALSRGNNEKPFETYFLTTSSRLFLVAASLCCHLKSENIDKATSSLITQNTVFAISGLHSLMGERQSMNFDNEENEIFLKAFQLLESGKGVTVFASIISGDNLQGNGDRPHQSPFVVYLLKRLGKIAIQMESIQMEIVFNIFTLLAKKIAKQNNVSADTTELVNQSYVYEMLLPIYKVCEGFSGRFIEDEIKQMAQERLEGMRDTLGMHNYGQVYNLITKNLKENRNKRKREEKLMAVVNPMMNAKKKMKLAAKSKANRKRKVMSLKMSQWMR